MLWRRIFINRHRDMCEKRETPHLQAFYDFIQWRFAAWGKNCNYRTFDFESYARQVVLDPSACSLAFCPDPSYLEPPGLLFVAIGSVIDVYSAFNLGRLSTLRLGSEDQPLEITALNSVQQVLYCIHRLCPFRFIWLLAEITSRG